MTTGAAVDVETEHYSPLHPVNQCGLPPEAGESCYVLQLDRPGAHQGTPQSTAEILLTH